MSLIVKHLASCSFGKDSLAAVLLAKLHGEPLDEAIYCEVMFDRNISRRSTGAREFIYTTAIPALERMGVKVTVLRAEKTYVDLFTGKITRGPKKGLLRAFPICGRCYVQRDCKLKPIQQYQKTFPPDTVKYIGIAKDEQARLLRLGGTKVSLLGQIWVYGTGCKGALPTGRGSYLLSMSLPTGAGAGSVPMQRGKNCSHLYDHHPDLWNRMLELQALPGKVSEKFNRTERFSDIDARFRMEDEQIKLWQNAA